MINEKLMRNENCEMLNALPLATAEIVAKTP
jgi:hypothetical protein